MTALTLLAFLASPLALAGDGPPLLPYLDCMDSDCDQALEEVLAYKGDAIAPLVAVLEEGTSRTYEAELGYALAIRYDALVEAGAEAGVKLPLDRDGFVAHGLDQADAAHRIRAAQALAQLGGSEAKEALYDAKAQPHRADVLAAVVSAIEALGA